MGIRSYLEACGVAFVAVAAGLVTVGGAIGTVVILAWKYTRGRRE
jgi:hypothetical protein